MKVESFGQASIEVNKTIRELKNTFPDNSDVQDLANRVHQECRSFLKEAAFGGSSSVKNNFWQGRVDVYHT
ncbi:MAG: hypothetical protein QNJ27_00540 [Simkaniaceae bacterium]|nr:hypothetical protein [Simkaniaceae bacterium]